MAEREPSLVLLRHGESTWNSDEIFAGWVDVPLTPRGREQAVAAGRRLAESGLVPDRVHTSLLSRTRESAQLALQACGDLAMDPRPTWRLNERHYGALQGRSKRAVLDAYGPERYAAWRRSLRGRPPVGEVGPGGLPSRWGLWRPPRTESLAEVRTRLLPYWSRVVLPELRQERTTWVVAHGNSLRMLIQVLEYRDEHDLSAIEVPNARPVVYLARDVLAPAPATPQVLG